MPTTPYDAKGLLISSIEDDNPVIVLEHRWLYNITGLVPEGIYRVPLGKARVAREGKDMTIVSLSYMTLEALQAAETLSQDGITVEVIDVRTLKPLDDALILESVHKTGHVLIADTGCKNTGFGAEIMSRIVEESFKDLRAAPKRIGLPDYPSPSSPSLAADYYPRAVHIVREARQMLGLVQKNDIELKSSSIPLDVPDASFTGPF